MTNKELIDRLVTYYLEQEPAVIARMLANFQLDHYRCATFESLPEQEQDCLIVRLQHNNRELLKFAGGAREEPMQTENIQNWFEVPCDEGGDLLWVCSKCGEKEI